MVLIHRITDILESLGVDPSTMTNGDLDVFSPVTGEILASVATDTPAAVTEKISAAQLAFREWRSVPAPRRGELVRLLGEKLRAHKDALGALVTIECGKILTEGLGEVQEMIDICDFAVGLSRQLYGLTIASERPGHRMSEYWLPIGPVGVISAFNFPVAVWSWNAAVALVCGNTVIWKPSEKTPLTAIACQQLFLSAAAEFGDAPKNLSTLIIGDGSIGAKLVSNRGVPLISATGSTEMGRKVGPVVAERFGRSILELGGNNGFIVCPSANLDMALTATVFGAVGTAGQRCTSTRRLFVHDSIYREFLSRLKKAYASISIGDPMNSENLVGPLIDSDAFNAMQTALRNASQAGGKVHGGERVHESKFPDAYYVRPALVEMGSQKQSVQTETFAPVLYVYSYSDFADVLSLHNDVPQGLSSAIFTNNLSEAENFISPLGSDCGIANINIGTSGAEIGGAFGGEKDTGGGRESGSDAWKGYMRRLTSTTNYSTELPLAQGVRFTLSED